MEGRLTLICHCQVTMSCSRFANFDSSVLVTSQYKEPECSSGSHMPLEATLGLVRPSRARHYNMAMATAMCRHRS